MTQLSPSKRWARSAPRDGRGCFAPKKPLDAAGEAERMRRLARDHALRAQQQDQRTRVGRRARAIERQLREMLRRQNQPITVDIDLVIGQIAAVAVRLEILRAEQSRGIIVDSEKMTRCANTVARALAKLGLRPTLIDGERMPRGLSVARQRWNEQAAKTADRASATKNNMAPDDRPRAASAK